MSSSFLKKAGAALTLAFLISSSLVAQTLVITGSQSAPTDPILNITVPDTGSAFDSRMIRNWTNPASGKGRHREVGQTFYVPTDYQYEISAMTFRVRLPGQTSTQTAAGQRVKISIYEVGSGSSATPVGPALFEAEGIIPDGLSALDYITFTFSEPFTAQPDTYYSAQLGFSGSPAGSAYMTLVVGSNSIYTDGTGFYYENPEGSATMAYGSTTADFDFNLSGRTIPVIPEGGTANLVLGGAAALGVVVLRQRRKISIR